MQWDDNCANTALQVCQVCGSNHTEAPGQLRTVTDANGVETRFLYDSFGQPNYEIEGAVSEAAPFWKVYIQTVFDPASRLTQAARYGKFTQRGALAHGSGAEARRHAQSACAASYSYGACSNPTGISCCAIPISGGGGTGPACPDFAPLGSDGTSLMYDPMDQLTHLETSVLDGGAGGTGENSTIELNLTYDPLGRIETSLHSSTEPTWNTTGQPVERWFSYTYDDDAGVYTRTGPDGSVTTFQTDLAGRVTHLERTTPAGIAAPISLGVTLTPGLVRNDVFEIKQSITIPSAGLPSGSVWYIVADVDDSGAISETNESNNSGYHIVKIN